jgi:hypothetical protein
VQFKKSLDENHTGNQPKQATLTLDTIEVWVIITPCYVLAILLFLYSIVKLKNVKVSSEVEVSEEGRHRIAGEKRWPVRKNDFLAL